MTKSTGGTDPYKGRELALATLAHPLFLYAGYELVVLSIPIHHPLTFLPGKTRSKSYSAILTRRSFGSSLMHLF